MQNKNTEYLAFISYSRADNEHNGRRWADWVKKTLDEFPIDIAPKNVFLDRESLSAGGKLDEELKKHLKASHFIILLCSPNSAKSKYVSTELDYFKNEHGLEKIIPMVISGNAPSSTLEDQWLAKDQIDIDSQIYADFRSSAKQRNNTMWEQEGWTNPLSYTRDLKKKKLGSKSEIELWSATYAERHKVARFALLSALFDKPPEELEQIEKEHLSKSSIIRYKRQAGILAVLLIVFGFVAWLAIRSEKTAQHERGKAEKERNIAQLERVKAERSLQLIGDAHESAIRMISDVLVDLRSSRELGKGGDAFVNAQRIVNDHLEESIPPGNNNDSIHMRAVVLDSRGYLARRVNDFTAAEKFYQESLRLREDLSWQEPDNTLYQHNLSVSHDNIGDCHFARAVILRSDNLESKGEFDQALSQYREGLDVTRKLVARQDSVPQWKHDFAVSYFKLGNALYEADEPGKALIELIAGMKLAQELADMDPDYAKWQAHLSAFCLQIGRIHLLAVEDDKAKPFLKKGQELLNKLSKADRLTHQYANWLAQIDKLLLDLE